MLPVKYIDNLLQRAVDITHQRFCGMKRFRDLSTISTPRPARRVYIVSLATGQTQHRPSSVGWCHVIKFSGFSRILIDFATMAEITTEKYSEFHLTWLSLVSIQWRNRLFTVKGAGVWWLTCSFNIKYESTVNTFLDPLLFVTHSIRWDILHSTF